MGCGARVPFSRRIVIFLRRYDTILQNRFSFCFIHLFGKKLAGILAVIKIFDYLLIFVEIRSVSTETVMKANKIKIHIFVRKQIN